MRRGELIGIRRSRVVWETGRITVDSAISESKQLKGNKTRRGRTFHVDADTIDMLHRHCDLIDERALAEGTTLRRDPFLFSLVADCSEPIRRDTSRSGSASSKDASGSRTSSPRSS